MPAIPVEVKTALKVLNLEPELSTNEVWSEHQANVLMWLEKVTLSNAYVKALNEEPESFMYANQFKYAYCFYLLSSVLEFINLKTLGSGIIKTTGIDAQTTELLTGDEILSFKNNLEIRALESVSVCLSAYGKARLKELKYGKSNSELNYKRTRAVLI